MKDNPRKLESKNRLPMEYKIPSLNQLGFKDFNVDKRSSFPFKGGTKSGIERVNNYLWETKKLSFYKNTRNGLIGIDYSSKLSSWLANGSLSPKMIYWEIKKYENQVIRNRKTKKRKTDFFAVSAFSRRGLFFLKRMSFAIHL